MFGKLFNKKKDDKALVQKLRQTEEVLKKKRISIGKRIDSELAIARKNAKNNKPVALGALKRKAKWEKMVLQIDGTLKTTSSTIKLSKKLFWFNQIIFFRATTWRFTSCQSGEEEEEKCSHDEHESSCAQKMIVKLCMRNLPTLHTFYVRFLQKKSVKLKNRIFFIIFCSKVFVFMFTSAQHIILHVRNDWETIKSEGLLVRKFALSELTKVSVRSGMKNTKATNRFIKQIQITHCFHIVDVGHVGNWIPSLHGQSFESLARQPIFWKKF